MSQQKNLNKNDIVNYDILFEKYIATLKNLIDHVLVKGQRRYDCIKIQDKFDSPTDYKKIIHPSGNYDLGTASTAHSKFADVTFSENNPKSFNQRAFSVTSPKNKSTLFDTNSNKKLQTDSHLTDSNQASDTKVNRDIVFSSERKTNEEINKEPEQNKLSYIQLKLDEKLKSIYKRNNQKSLFYKQISIPNNLKQDPTSSLFKAVKLLQNKKNLLKTSNSVKSYQDSEKSISKSKIKKCQSLPNNFCLNEDSSCVKKLNMTDIMTPSKLLEKSKSKYISTKIMSNTSSKRVKIQKRRKTERLLEKNLLKLEASIELMNKYANPDIIEQFSKVSNGYKQLVMAIRDSKKKSNTKIDNPINGIFDERGIMEKNSKSINVNKVNIPALSIYKQVNEEYKDGSRYEGEKILNKRHGNGIYYYKEGHKYEGCWKNDKMTGFGILWFNNTKKWYEGEWSNNTFHGNGILFNNNPDSQHDINKFDGQNFLKLSNNWLKYHGPFKRGKKHGFGLLFMKNGDIFSGHFINDTIHGKGSYTKNNNQAYIGLWECNRLVYYL